MRPLQRAIEDKGPQTFSIEEVSASHDLFMERCALIYTPTSSVPEAYIGEGILDVTLPLATPSYYEFYEARMYKTPRLWVDLLQRATGKIRWRPMHPAHVTIIRYDSVELPWDFLCGAKSLVDALKASTHGRPDRRVLYYFGAILDDSPAHIEIEYKQELVEHPSQAKTRVIVRPQE